MAGLGTRTSKEYDSPKPLIMVHERPLFSWAIEGLPIDLASEIRVVTNSHVARHPEFETLLKQFMPTSLKISVQILQKLTSGQAETVRLGTEDIERDSGILVFNCDTYISDNFPRDFEKWDGILGTFHSTNPGMSYLETNDQKVIRTVEKQVISTQASTGLYYFGSKEVFDKAFFASDHLKESYVAPMYNSMIRDGLDVGSFDTTVVHPLGTFEEIEMFKQKWFS
jgi:NDP-sugar pyrophosphorylase family protein